MLPMQTYHPPQPCYTHATPHSGGWLTFSCPHGVVYYLKFLLRSDSSCDYIDCLLSMKHIPNVVLIDMAHIIAKHVLMLRREDVQNYANNEEGVLFEPYFGRVAETQMTQKT